MAAERQPLQVVPAMRGLAWLAGALALLRRQPARLMLIGLVLQFLMGFSQVPLLMVLLILLIPAFSAGMMQVMLLVDHGARPPLAMVFAAFSSSGKLLRLMVLGAFIIGGGVLALTLDLSGSMSAIDPALVARLREGDIAAMDSLDPALLQRWLFTMLAGFVAGGSISYFAAPLIWFMDLPLGRAIGNGLLGMIRNWRAFLVMGLLVSLLAFPVGALTGLLLTASAPGSMVSPVFMVVMLLVSVVFQLVLFGAQYVAFSDVFGIRQEPGPEAGEDGQLVA